MALDGLPQEAPVWPADQEVVQVPVSSQSVSVGGGGGFSDSQGVSLAIGGGLALLDGGGAAFEVGGGGIMLDDGGGELQEDPALRPNWVVYWYEHVESSTIWIP